MERSKCLEEKHVASPPSWHTNDRYFFIGKIKVVKFARSSSEMVLRTTKHTMIYPD
jgi:hypothetical protein